MRNGITEVFQLLGLGHELSGALLDFGLEINLCITQRLFSIFAICNIFHSEEREPFAVSIVRDRAGITEDPYPVSIHASDPQLYVVQVFALKNALQRPFFEREYLPLKRGQLIDLRKIAEIELHLFQA